MSDDTRRPVLAWLTTGKRRSRATRRAYADDIRHWATYGAEVGMPRLSLAALTPGHVTVWRTKQEMPDDRGRVPSARTVARRLSSLSSLCDHAARHGLPVVNPVDREDHRPAIDKHDRAAATPVLEIGEIQAMIGAADDARDALVVSLLYTAAGRVSEVCAADVVDFRDGRTAELYVTRKGGKRRALALPAPVAELLAAHVGARTMGPLLLAADGTRLDRHDVDRMLTRLGHRAGHRSRRVHVLHPVRREQTGIVGARRGQQPLDELMETLVRLGQREDAVVTEPLRTGAEQLVLDAPAQTALDPQHARVIVALS